MGMRHAGKTRCRIDGARTANSHKFICLAQSRFYPLHVAGHFSEPDNRRPEPAGIAAIFTCHLHRKVGRPLPLIPAMRAADAIKGSMHLKNRR